jgi:3-deoxy-D-manno-octulosonic-acid transferase
VDSLGYGLWQTLGGLAALPAVLWSTARGRFGGRWGERLGFARADSQGALWVHAVSAGEAAAALEVIRELQTRLPDADFLLTVTTPTGLAFAEASVEREKLPRVKIAAAPLDFFGAPGRALKKFAPRALIILETEIWPGLIHKASSLGVPVLVASGRISPRAHRRYRAAKPLFRGTLRSLSLVCSITESDRKRYVSLGAKPDRAFALGSPKYDRLIGVARSRPYAPSSLEPPFVVVAGSTHAGEEEIVLSSLLKASVAKAVKSGDLTRKIRLILAPRYVHRAPEVLALAKRKGFTASLVRDADFERGELSEVSVVDVLGKLGDFYARSDLALVGGSFVAGLGHNPLEPAALGRAVIFGPNMATFSHQAMFLMDNLACKMVLPAQLANIFLHFVSIPSLARLIGQNGRQAVAALEPAAPRIADKIMCVLKKKGRLGGLKVNEPEGAAAEAGGGPEKGAAAPEASKAEGGPEGAGGLAEPKAEGGPEGAGG